MRSKKAIINIVVSLLLQLIAIIYGFIIPRLIIETFGSETNGLIASITQFLGYIVLLEAGVGPVVKAVLYKPIANKKKEEVESILKSADKFFKKISYIFLIYIVILCCIYPFIVNTSFGVLFTISLIVIISINKISEYYFGMVYRIYLQAEQKTYITSLIQMAGYIINIILFITLINLDSNILIIQLAISLIYILRPMIQNIYVKKKYNIKLKENKSEYKLKQKWDGLAQHIAAVVNGNTDIAVISIFIGVAEASVYSVYLLIITGIKSLIIAITSNLEAGFGDMIAKGEKENLRKKFMVYETMYYTILTIVFSATFVLIVPFIKVYMSGITDINYIVPTFAFLFVLGQFTHLIRTPYSTLILAAGHFKQTRNGAWVEVALNLIISIVLVINFGIIGVAIGTFIAMLVRTIEFIIYTSKNILERTFLISIKRIIIIIIQVSCIIGISSLLPKFIGTTYLEWSIYAIKIAGISIIIVGLVNIIMYNKDFKEVFNVFKKIIKK